MDDLSDRFGAASMTAHIYRQDSPSSDCSTIAATLSRVIAVRAVRLGRLQGFQFAITQFPVFGSARGISRGLPVFVLHLISQSV
jgi:hypothetical protein